MWNLEGKRQSTQIGLCGAFLLLTGMTCFGQQAPSPKSQHDSPNGARAPAAQGAGPAQVSIAAAPLDLPDTMAGVKASEAMKVASVTQLAGEKAGALQEYQIGRAVSRQYGDFQVQLFEASSPIAAFGLFSFSALDAPRAGSIDLAHTITAHTTDGAVALSGRLVARILTDRNQPGDRTRALKMAAAAVKASGPIRLPELVDSLPDLKSAFPGVRYFTGPVSLGVYLPHGSEMFTFGGDAGAVVGFYPAAMPGPAAKTGSSGATGTNSPKSSGRMAGTGILRLAIVEYHTPQFAEAAWGNANGYLAGLPPDDRRRLVIKRVGNYIVEAAIDPDAPAAVRQQAEELMSGVSYPYTIKWLKDPHSRNTDRFAGQKAAAIILSSFGIVGMLGCGALAGGAVFGTVTFLRRRRRQLKAFSDAGGMLCLDIAQLTTGAPDRFRLRPGSEPAD